LNSFTNVFPDIVLYCKSYSIVCARFEIARTRITPQHTHTHAFVQHH